MNLHQKMRFQYIWKAVLLAFFICMSSVSYAADTDYVWVPYNDPTAGTGLLPRFEWSCGCSPTAGAMVLGYWDNYGPTGGGNWGKFTAYGRLIDYYIDEDTLESYQGSDSVNFYWQHSGSYPTRPMLIVDLAWAMDTTGNEGSTFRSNQAPGINSVVNSKGYGNGWANRDTWFCWTGLKGEIDDGRPVMVSIPNHSVCCFGYSETYDKFATHDPNYATRYDYDKAMLDDSIVKVDPENGISSEDVDLKAPDGGENWEAESSQTISWYQYNGSRIDNVDIYYSTNGGATFSTIATWVSTSYGWNYYTWNIPSGINSSRMRIKIRGWEGGSACLSEDGSQENFTVENPVTLSHITISGSTQVNENSGAQYTCTAYYSDGSSSTVTSSSSWSENSSYASIGSSSGYLTTYSVSSDQSCTITATYGGKSDTHNVTIKNVPATLSYITISGSTQVNENFGAQYTCTAYYSDGSSSTVTSSASWSENSSYASISSSGYLTTSSVSSDQSCTITATYGGKSDTHSVTIKNVPATLSYIRISGSTQVNENSGAQYTCTAHYSDGSSSTVTSSASWSENSSYASISSSGYLTTSSVSSDQSCTITATYGGKSDTHSVTIKNVPATLSYIRISGSTQVNENSGAQYTCTAHYSDGSSSTVTSSASWSENSSYASISSSGYLTTSSVSSDQSCTITATYGGKSDTHSVTIKNVPATLSYIRISGSTQVNENSGAQYTCTAHYSDGSSSTVTSSASWSENSSYASINSSGYLTTTSVSSDQACTITATYGGKSDTHNVIIKAATVTSLTISGPTEVNGGSGAQYTCTAHYSDGSTSTVTSSASWSENSSYASINSSGYLTTTSVSSDQACTITATYGGKSDTHNVKIVYTFEGPTLDAGTRTGTPDLTVDVPITLTNNTTVVSCQFDTVFNSNILEGDGSAEPGPALEGKGFSVSSSVIESGKIRIVIIPPPEFPIPIIPNGEIIILPIHIKPDAQESTETLNFENIVGSDEYGNPIYIGYVPGEIFITYIQPGDANGDGDINVLDVICIINVILDTGTASGSPDCNDDGDVNVQDVICVINKILGG